MEIQTIAENFLSSAIKAQASDIFIVPGVKKYRISLRVKEGIEFLKEIELGLGKELLNYFKFSAQMDIAEHRRPQVGSWIREDGKSRVFLRLSSVGNFNDQESLVIRLIYSAQKNSYFFPEQLDILKNLSSKRGMIVTSGPTGSGKTSTMYEVARLISKNKMVMTIEDPIEIWEPSFLQTQINPAASIEYLDLLKAALRHRPDILIIGEIRDAHTAKVAIGAALSGHLVLATVHAKSTFQTISRLEGLGIRKDELYNALTAVSYQRLLPTKTGELSCIIDIASGDNLKKQISVSKRDDFISWNQNLHQLKKENRIDEITFNNYQAG